MWNKIPDSINISDVKLDGAHEQLDMLEDDMVESNKHYAQTRKPPNWECISQSDLWNKFNLEMICPRLNIAKDNNTNYELESSIWLEHQMIRIVACHQHVSGRTHHYWIVLNWVGWYIMGRGDLGFTHSFIELLWCSSKITYSEALHRFQPNSCDKEQFPDAYKIGMQSL